MVERNSCIMCFGVLNAAKVYRIILCLNVGRRILLRKLWYVIDRLIQTFLLFHLCL